VGGCDALNPSFVGLIDPSGASSTIPNASGHIVIQFVNNAEVSEALISDLEANGGLFLTAGEKRVLKPRVRFRIRVTFLNGATSTFEIVDGSKNLIDQSFSAEALPDLDQNDLSNAVVVCDTGVARIEILPGSEIEVFIPVEMTELVQREITAPNGETRVEFVESQQIPPQFRALRTDIVDADNNIILRQNVGIRNVSAPVINPVCGTVVAIVMDGVLAVPFHPEGQNRPSYDAGDQATVAGIGGRYEFRTVKLEN
jgi:hypothetical protein